MKQLHNNRAFTLIELLVVVAIISALVGILSVAQRKVKIVSKNLRQKAAFHGGEVSLELYSRDFGDYPDSARVEDGGTYVNGAQRVAEAFFGRDDRGFNPKSKWHPAKDPAGPTGLYSDATLNNRKIPYFERKRAGFYSIYELWGGAGNPGFGTSSIYNSGGSTDPTLRSPVFTDVFTMNKVTINGESEKVGMPILYFKADTTKENFRMISSGNSGRDGHRMPVDLSNLQQWMYQNWIYNFDDNLDILELPWLRDPTADTDTPNEISPHYQDTEINNPAGLFYKMITQREDAAANFYKPHNASTFILISAGYDGIYGTKDDLTNFDY